MCKCLITLCSIKGKATVDKSVDKNQVLQMADLFKNFKKNENDFTFDFKTSEGLIKKLKIELK